GYYTFELMLRDMERVKINQEFILSKELGRILNAKEDISQYNKGPFILRRQENVKAYKDYESLLEDILNISKKGITIQRYKGLGEMNPEQLWKTTMDPEKRRLLRIKIEDFLEAEGIFSVLMGDKVDARRQFIQENALEVKELDI
ncbi:MAG TPA: DNA gyrase subunit B, partial [Desulfobacteraceae bacterium]|nr:DNA gyrase subunit B [Desulfobacteraceae bacterium]